MQRPLLAPCRVGRVFHPALARAASGEQSRRRNADPSASRETVLLLCATISVAISPSLALTTTRCPAHHGERQLPSQPPDVQPLDVRRHADIAQCGRAARILEACERYHTRVPPSQQPSAARTTRARFSSCHALCLILKSLCKRLDRFHAAVFCCGQSREPRQASDCEGTCTLPNP
jgi:hypothetical protein